MPVPQTGYDQANPNTPLWTFDQNGNLILAGNYYAGGVPDTTKPFPGQPLTGGSLVPAGGSAITYLAPTGDTTGAADVAAIQAAIGSGNVNVGLGAGTFYVNTPLLPKGGLHLFGVSYLATTVIGVGSSALNAGASQTEDVEISNLELRANGHAVVTGANCVRWYVHDCRLNQLDGTTAGIWNANPVGVMVECRFWRNREDVQNGGPTAVEAWFLTSSSGATQVNVCSWVDNVCFSTNGGVGVDTSTKYWYHLAQTGSSVLNESCTFQNIAWEHPAGGMVWLESMIGGLIDNCYSYDSGSGTWVNPGFKLSKNTTGGQPQRNTIRNSGRTDAGPSGTATFDIQQDANCFQTVIDTCGCGGGSAPFLIDLGNAPAFHLRNMQSSFTLTNGPTVPARTIFHANDTSTNSVVTLRSGATAPAQPILTTENKNAAENAIGCRVDGDTSNRLKVTSSGVISAGPGNATQDVALQRGGSGLWQISTDQSAGTFKSLIPNSSGILFKARTGALGETIPRYLATVATSQITTSGTIYLTAIVIPAGTVISNITYNTGITNLKTGGTHGWYILVDSGLVIRAATADQTDASTVWGTASTEYTLPIATAGGASATTFTTTYTGLYYTGIMVANSAGTQPNIVATASAAAGLGGTPKLSGNCSGGTGTGQTTPPLTDGTVTLSLTSDLSRYHYAYVS